ncbi:hypothetical protein PC9H_004678 [Pleurotus ostreatus]|uniref:Uncharacterized protein n=1 Tax=Pleurotus ostreatus TaxID=5322 RepID=A0A8H6ZV70_PLEOS|nr:uncharacterized protein PC9H_004678 [Pleurotus ostreatus]KAF7432735.1 hypothetical protein PC9H_004678 [Pleurotus ostreatus]
MSFAAGINGPTYISSHSADVILSDIRPIKLKIEALRCINVLLDEFLYSILAAARSLSTDKLRAGLLKVLPTNLGKEALLEAEVELRAYWERTKLPGGPSSPMLEEGQGFNLQWSFELLRLKCEAYSTLNEHDENLAAETSLNERMSQHGGFTPPKTTLVAPAALYLTAILEHVLGNVGRVASRDSSRANASVQDLFVALCEDEAIYGLFKGMKVYDQIELLSQSSKHQRSKSFTRNDKSLSRTSSPQLDLPPTPPEPFAPSVPIKSRQSSESANADPFFSPPRTSTDKPRGVKKFIPGRSSHDESQNGHKRSDSVYSADSRGDNEKFDVEDSALLQEFDDLMRSNATMKVSLTPDRLRTMEAHKRDQKGNNRPPPVFAPKVEPEPPATHATRANGRRPSLRHVDSIIEDDEEVKISLNDHTSPSPLPDANRTRSASVAAPSSSVVPNNNSEHSLPGKMTAIMGTKAPPSSFGSYSKGPERQAVFPDSDGRPPRTRKIQRNRESLDLDDIMGDSDDERPAVDTQSKPPASRNGRPMKVSASTRELIDFLAEGPPDLPQPPFPTSPPSLDGGKQRGSGRLQRMMSKLSMGNSDKSKTSESPSRPRRVTLQSKPSITNISPLANRPIPPRPPPVSPPESPPASSFDDVMSSSSRSRAAVSRKTAPEWEPQAMETQPNFSRSDSTRSPDLGAASRVAPPTSTSPLPPPPPVLHSRLANGSTSSQAPEVEPVKDDQVKKTRRASLLQRVPVPSVDPSLDIPPRSSARPSPAVTPVPSTPETTSRAPSAAAIERRVTREASTGTNGSPPTPDTPHVSAQSARDLQRLMAIATNADECRLVLHAVLTASGIAVDPPVDPAVAARSTVPVNTALESTLIELFLGNGPLETDASLEEPRETPVVVHEEEKENIPLPSPPSSYIKAPAPRGVRVHTTAIAA